MKSRTCKCFFFLAVATTVYSGNVNACAVEPYIGTVCATAANFCPRGYLPLEGQEVPISNFQSLYSLLGTVYGGNGVQSFSLPDMRGRSAIGAGKGAGLSDVKLGTKRGVEAVSQTTGEMAPHNHHVDVQHPDLVANAVRLPANLAKASPYGSIATVVGPDGELLNTFYDGSETATVSLRGFSLSGGNVSVANAGSGLEQTNLPPQLSLTYCIAHEGIYPSRP